VAHARARCSSLRIVRALRVKPRVINVWQNFVTEPLNLSYCDVAFEPGLLSRMPITANLLALASRPQRRILTRSPAPVQPCEFFCTERDLHCSFIEEETARTRENIAGGRKHVRNPVRIIGRKRECSHGGARPNSANARAVRKHPPNRPYMRQ